MPPDEVLVDTSALVALANDEEVTDRIFDAQGKRLAVVSSLAWGELASLAQQGRVGMDKVEAIAERGRTETVGQEDCVIGGRLHGQMRKAGHGKVGLADCIIYATARRLGIDLLTLDSDLEGLPGVQVIHVKGKRSVSKKG